MSRIKQGDERLYDNKYKENLLNVEVVKMLTEKRIGEFQEQNTDFKF